MPNFPNVTAVRSGERTGTSSMVSRRQVTPASIRSRSIGQEIVRNTSGASGTFALADGTMQTITVRTYNTRDESIRLGSCPFQVALFEAASLGAVAPETNQIPYQTTINDYVIDIMAMPDYTVGGKRYYLDASDNKIRFASDGNDVVWKIGITNNSGGAKNITYIISTKFIQSRGGGA